MNPRIPLASILIACQIPASSLPYNLYEVVGSADSGSSIKAFETLVSINNDGDVACIGRTTTSSTSEKNFVSNLSGPLTEFSSATNYSRYLQLNDAGYLVSGRTGTGTNIRVLIPGGTPFLVENSPNPTYDTVARPTINNSGDVVFSANGGPAGALVSSVVYQPADQNASATVISQKAGNHFVVPMVSDPSGGSRVVTFRDGPSAADPVVSVFVTSAPPTVATSATVADFTEFDSLGSAPGISDSGKAIAFYGDPKTGGAGIFVAFNVGSNSGGGADWKYFRVAQSFSEPGFFAGDIQWTNLATGSGGACSSGNRTYALSQKGEVATARIDGFYPDERVNVQLISDPNDPVGNGIYKILFAADSVWGGGANNVALRTGKSLYTAVVRLVTNPTTELEFLAGPQYFAGLLDNILISDDAGKLKPLGLAALTIHDSLNTKGQVAFWARTVATENGIAVNRESIVKGESVIEPMRQNQYPWAADRYADWQFDEYVAKLSLAPVPFPQSSDIDCKPTMVSIKTQGTLTLGAKGCTMTSLAMLVNTLRKENHQELSQWETTRTIHETAFPNSMLTDIRNQEKADCGPGEKRFSGASKLPVFDGLDFLWRKEKARLVFDYELPAGGQINTKERKGRTAVWNYLMGFSGDGSGPQTTEAKAALLRRGGGHFILAASVARPVGPSQTMIRRVYLVDPYTNKNLVGNSPVNYKDRVLSAPEEFEAALTAGEDKVKEATFVRLANGSSPAPATGTSSDTPLRNGPQKISIPALALVHGVSGMDFVATSPTGLRMGRNPLTGEAYNEIPGADYFIEVPTDPPEGVEGLSAAELDEYDSHGPRFLRLASAEAGDYVVEAFGSETFGEVNLTFEADGSAGELVSSTQTIVVVEGGSAASAFISGSSPEPVILVRDVLAVEGESSVAFSVVLSHPITTDVTFDFTTQDGSAVAPADYANVTVSGATIAAGSLSTSIIVLIANDGEEEGTEHFNLVLSNVSGAQLLNDRATATIVDADADPLAIYNAVAASAGLIGEDSEPNATPFDDGVENLLKYAFNMNLAGPDAATMAAGGSAGLPVISQSGSGASGVLRFEFVRRFGSGLVYTPKKSTSLGAASWTTLSDEPTISPIGTEGLWERVIYEEPSDPSVVPVCFGRVEVAIP